ncbi:hypothetical protein nbrc107696_01520 [Gordonia spumicola]|uniref:HTH cro/C1-type domain-containing protein n=1 Tax=Gordonia spumicola TaxID=589161 RepID=A0A7I9V2S5_9ACTN|nr:helix-turn-helix transcriptional regulator [Gordonia spumicola]GED99705.1 hypothetical protein nbrc107696_01520 [Gordonia spumicola]
MSDSSPEIDAPKLDDQRFAENMKAIRISRGMSQSDLVEALRALGWTSVFQTTVSRIENGDRPVRYGESRVIARALGVHAERFLLPAQDQELASKLAAARLAVRDNNNGIVGLALNMARARRALERVIDDARANGFEPTDLPSSGPDEWVELVPVSVSDELALALEALEQMTPESAVRTGLEVDERAEQRAKANRDAP